MEISKIEEEELDSGEKEEEELYLGDKEEEELYLGDKEEEELDLGELEKELPSKKSGSKPGIIYFSSIPPYMKPNKVRNIMSQYGEVGKIFLQPEDTEIRKRRKVGGGSGKPCYYLDFNFSDKVHLSSLVVFRPDLFYPSQLMIYAILLFKTYYFISRRG